MTVAEQVSCTHCGLPVPPALVEEGGEHQFCCEGCRTVYGAIHAGGLDRYYALRREQETSRAPARVSGRSYEELDDPAFADLYVREAPDGLRATELYLEGVHCAACVWLVEKVPVLVEGAIDVRLDLGRARARVLWDPRQVALSTIARRLDALGYPAHPFRGVEADAMARREDRRLLIRMGVAGAAAGNIMLIAVALYSGMFTGIDPALEHFFRWASMIVALPAVLWSATVFYRGAWGALRAGALHMDVPISLGILVAFGWGALNTVLGRGEIYFDSVAVLIFLLLVGRWLLRRQQRSAADATELLHALTPSSARLLVDGEAQRVREVPVEALVPGALVEVRAGESVPADGVVVAGESQLDRSLLTGESRPEGVGPGADVHAGTVNLAARLVVRVDRTGEQSRVGRLLELVDEHARRRAPVVQLADRLSGWFVVAVLVLAAMTAALWGVRDPAAAVDHAVALLIVTCPCALGLATPLAVSAAIGRAARAGLLVKGGDAVERLARPGRLWLDKTGTVTAGRMTVVRWWGDEPARRLVAVLERHSSHPVARALANGGDDRVGVEAVRERRGAGIAGRVDGREVVAGAPEHVREQVADWPPALDRALAAALDENLTPVAVAVDGRAVALAGIGDDVREDAPAAFAALRAQGWQLGILSGDHPDVVAAVARRLDVVPERARGGASPEDKLRVVQADAARGPVVMVGDGVNDAAALAAATAGIGVHGGAEAALAAADVFVTRDGLAPLVDLFAGARRTLRVIRRGLVFSLLYNAVGASLAMAGLITPLLAAVMMPASSLTVIAIAYRSRTF
jgi:Cu2+-exporting ATPase